MADDKLQQKLIDYVEDAHAMEQNVSMMLDSMMTTTDDPEITEMLKHHQEETERHEQRLRGRLDALGAGTSTRKQAQTIATALMKGAADQVRGDQAGKNARERWVHHRAHGDSRLPAPGASSREGRRPTDGADVARQNRAEEEEAMAQKIDANWDRFLDLTLAENDTGT